MELDKFKALIDHEVTARIPPEITIQAFAHMDDIGPYVIIQRRGSTMVRRPIDTPEGVNNLYAIFLED